MQGKENLFAIGGFPQVSLAEARAAATGGFPETLLCPRLIALTACCLGEAADAEWDEFDFEDVLWRRLAAKMKAA